jgi:hypothetical protein
VDDCIFSWFDPKAYGYEIILFFCTLRFWGGLRWFAAMGWS